MSGQPLTSDTNAVESPDQAAHMSRKAGAAFRAERSVGKRTIMAYGGRTQYSVKEVTYRTFR